MTVTKTIKTNRKSERSETQKLLAQYFTSQSIATFMADFLDFNKSDISLLDAGAGQGILGITALKKLKNLHSKNTAKSRATFVEFDTPTYQILKSNLSKFETDFNIVSECGDFVDVGLEWSNSESKFTHIIINPPYFKLRTNSEASIKLRQHGIHVTNIYAAFMWLCALLLKNEGEMVAIVPRSFCNGTYFTKFRQFLADAYSIDSIHSFNSRNKAFAADSVLQENIIIKISKRPQIEKVTVSYSDDNSFSDIKHRSVDSELIISSTDETKIIHIPAENQTLVLGAYLVDSILDLGLKISTGPVVDFRLKANISFDRVNNSIPLLYSQHMNGILIQWPSEEFKKKGQHYLPVESKNSVLPIGQEFLNDKNVLPLDGYYVVVRRFSSKEEKRRIFASVVDPSDFESKYVSFENHLNYYHLNRHGFGRDMAFGLCAYLNSPLLDEHFRKLSGHTQVNVGDLKKIPYPSKTALEKIGTSVDTNNQNADQLIDELIKENR